jgi:hypothetical protein
MQTEMILNHLRSGKTLTSLNALQLFGSMRLAARIQEIKDRGIKVNSHMIKLASGKRVAAYELAR